MALLGRAGTACRDVEPWSVGMSSGGLSGAIDGFLAAHIRSIDDLHLLVAVAEDEDRWWDETSVARALGTTTRSARALLEHLAAHNLLDIRVTGDIRYRFRPGTPELATAARGCVEAYRTTPALVWRVITGAAERRGARDFADAFRIRRRDR